MAEQDDKYRILADFLKQVGFRRGAMLFFAGGVILVLWKTDPIALIDRLSREKAETRVEAEQPVTKKGNRPALSGSPERLCGEQGGRDGGGRGSYGQPASRPRL